MRVFLYEVEVDPLVSHVLSGAQLNREYVPVDCIPDPSPDPFEALALKEEGELVTKIADFDPNDIGRPSVFEYMEFAPPNLDDLPFIFTEEPDAQHHLAERIERLCLTERPCKFGFSCSRYRSNGRRGRKPRSKNRFDPIVVY